MFYIKAGINRYTIPAIIDAKIPNSITGPAIEKIFAPTPSTNPSGFDSIAGETTEFANPVIGTIVPAPANLASLGYRFKPVNSAPKNTNVIAFAVDAASLSRPIARYIYKNASPRQQINPPIINAFIQSVRTGDFGDFCFTYSLYSSAVILVFIIATSVHKNLLLVFAQIPRSIRKIVNNSLIFEKKAVTAVEFWTNWRYTVIYANLCGKDAEECSGM